MPDFPTGVTPTVRPQPANLTFYGSDGKLHRSQPSIPSGVSASAAQFRAAWNALANRSNAGLVRWSAGGTIEEILPAAAVRDDETHGAKTRAKFEFVAASGDTWTVNIPAPKATEFPGGVANYATGDLTTLFGDVITMLNTDGQTWGFSRAYIIGLRGITGRASGAEDDPAPA